MYISELPKNFLLPCEMYNDEMQLLDISEVWVSDFCLYMRKGYDRKKQNIIIKLNDTMIFDSKITMKLKLWNNSTDMYEERDVVLEIIYIDDFFDDILPFENITLFADL